MKRMLMGRPARKMAGLTLLETMFGIAIGALIIIAAIMFYQSTQNGQNVSRATSDINTILAQAENYIAPGKTALDSLVLSTGSMTAPDGTTTACNGNAVCQLQSAGYLPTTLTDPWGNVYKATVTASTSGANAGVPGTIAIQPTSLLSTDANCNAIATAVQGTNTGVLPDSGKGTEAGACTIKLNL